MVSKMAKRITDAEELKSGLLLQVFRPETKFQRVCLWEPSGMRFSWGEQIPHLSPIIFMETFCPDGSKIDCFKFFFDGKVYVDNLECVTTDYEIVE